MQGNEANVYLMGHENIVKYNKGLPFQALGGLIAFSPIRLQTISSAHWHLVIDLSKGYGQVKTSYRMLNSQPPNINTRRATFKPSEAQKSAVAASEALRVLCKEKSHKEKPPKTPPSPEQVSCKSCGTLTIRGKFCTECSAPTERKCPNCAVANALTCKFCYEYGCKLI